MLDSNTTEAVAEAGPAPRARNQARFPQHQPIVTYALLAILIGLFLLTYAAEQSVPLYEPNPVLVWGALDYTSVLNGEVYRLFTAMFLHLSWAHLFFNGYALYALGRGIESVMGHARFLLIYLLGGFLGSLLSLTLGRGASVGASGAIFALFGAEFVFVYRHRTLIGAAANNALRQLILLAALNLGIGFLTAVTPGGVKIDNWGHIGGLIGGLIVTSAIGPLFVIGKAEDGAPAIIDSRPLRLRWPMAAAILAAEVVVTGAAYLTLPR
jgi:rhomboid protease GluP